LCAGSVPTSEPIAAPARNALEIETPSPVAGIEMDCAELGIVPILFL
jgi:hypothetical protein